MLRMGHRFCFVFGPCLIFGDGVVVETNFTHAKDQLAGFNLYTGLVEAFYEGFQKLEELLKSVGTGCDVVRV